MCRLAAYVGPPRDLHGLWLAPAHNLIVQSYAPREMNGALLNADGFGMAWYTPASDEPALYRTVLPLWGDENVVRMARHLRTSCALANVRSATPGMGIQTSNVSPFVRGRWAFTHNGFVRSFRPHLLRRLRDGLDDAHYAAIEGNTDSEHLFALVAMHVLRTDNPIVALRTAMQQIGQLAREAGVGALLNVILTDGDWLLALRHAVGEPAPSLYQRVRDGVEVASEPLDDDGWEALAPDTILIVDPSSGVRTEAL